MVSGDVTAFHGIAFYLKSVLCDVAASDDCVRCRHILCYMYILREGEVEVLFGRVADCIVSHSCVIHADSNPADSVLFFGTYPCFSLLNVT